MIFGVFVDANEEDVHHRPSMLRWRALLVGVCLSASAVARADISAAQTPSVQDQEARFDLFVRTGNQARLAGRYNDAAIAYKEALDIHPHPVVSGRLGLALLKLGQIDRAAQLLHFAMEQGQGVTLHERQEVAAAYDKAKAATTWVSVTISQVGATVTCDGESWNREGISGFWRFAMPGEHTIRAKLDGYEEAVQTFTAKPGETIAISLKLVPIVKLEPISEDEPILRKKKRYFPPPFNSSNVWGSPDYDPKEDPTHGEPKETKPTPKKDGPRFSVNGGVVTVFGVASWNPAVGGVVGVGLRPKEFLSLGLEGRAAWLTTGVAGRQISAMTAGGLVSACGHLKWFFGCGLGSIGALHIEFSDESYTGKSSTHLKIGGGGRAGVLIHASDSVFFTGSIDVISLSRGTKLAVQNQVIADIAPIWAGGQISGGWEF
jgi:PEGA domain